MTPKFDQLSHNLSRKASTGVNQCLLSLMKWQNHLSGIQQCGLVGSGSAKVQSILQSWRKAPTRPQEILFFQRKKGQKCWMQQTTKPAQRSGGPMDQAQIPAPGNDFLFPVAVPGQPFPLWFMSPAPAEQTVRGLAQSRDQRHPQHSSSSFFFSSPPIKLCPTNCRGWRITGFNCDKTEGRGKKEEEEQETLGFPRSQTLPQLCPVPVKEEAWEVSDKADMH